MRDRTSYQVKWFVNALVGISCSTVAKYNAGDTGIGILEKEGGDIFSLTLFLFLSSLLHAHETFATFKNVHTIGVTVKLLYSSLNVAK